jgi:biopolymer transport protein ExbD
MSKRRHKKKHDEGGVTINLTAMLDMAFQLLAFFVLTFKPAPAEGEVSLRMPPPQAVMAAKVSSKSAGKSDKDLMSGLTSLVISVLPNKTGGLGTMAIGEQPIGTLAGLDNQLHSVLTDQASPFEQVIIQVGSGVRYDALMSVVDICTRQKLPNGQPLTKLSFVELPEG